MNGNVPFEGRVPVDRIQPPSDMGPAGAAGRRQGRFTVSIEFPAQMVDELERLSSATGASVGHIVRRAVDLYLQGDECPCFSLETP